MISERQLEELRQCMLNDGLELHSIIGKATRLFDGWEMDNDVWLVSDNRGNVSIYSTSHGGFYKVGTPEIESDINYMKECAESLNKLLDIYKIYNKE